MPKAGSKRWSRKIDPRTIRSNPGKIDLRLFGASVTDSSQSRMARARGSGLEPQHNAGDYQNDRPEFLETDTRESTEQENRADRDQQQRGHQTPCPATGAIAFRACLVGHSVPSYEVLFIRSTR